MTEQLKSIPRNLFRASPYIVYSSALLSSVITGNMIGVYFTVLCMVFGDVLNFALKEAFKAYDPYNLQWKRPNPPTDGCGIFGTCNTTDSTWGMPSGHAQIISFALAFWLLYLWSSSSISKTTKYISSAILIVLALLIMRSRLVEGCHNILQVTTGSIIGLFFGMLSYYLVKIVIHQV